MKDLIDAARAFVEAHDALEAYRSMVFAEDGSVKPEVYALISEENLEEVLQKLRAARLDAHRELVSVAELRPYWERR